MKSKFLIFSLSAALAAPLGLQAEPVSVATDPVGYVTFDVLENSDNYYGLPLIKEITAVSEVESVTVGEVGTNLSFSENAYENTHFILVTSGDLEGEWFEIVESNSGDQTLLVAEDLELEGLGVGDGFKIIPFWDLEDIFVPGENIESQDPFSPSFSIIFTDLNATGTNLAGGKTLVYHDGSVTGLGSGWYDSSNIFGGPVENTLLSPETFITIRNQSNDTTSFQSVGTVLEKTPAMFVLQRSAGAQDNKIFNPIPVDMEIADLGLESVVEVSTDPFSPTDFVFVFSSGTGLNRAATSTFIFHDGSVTGMGPGWYNPSSPFDGPQNEAIIESGSAITVRKSAGSDQILTWKPTFDLN